MLHVSIRKEKFLSLRMRFYIKHIFLFYSLGSWYGLKIVHSLSCHLLIHQLGIILHLIDLLTDVIDKKQGMEQNLIHRDKSLPSLI